jgi:hypothetical protein
MNSEPLILQFKQKKDVNENLKTQEIHTMRENMELISHPLESFHKKFKRFLHYIFNLAPGIYKFLIERNSKLYK